MIEQVVNHFPSEIMDPILNFLEKNVDEYVSRLPLEFGEELKGNVFFFYFCFHTKIFNKYVFSTLKRNRQGEQECVTNMCNVFG